MKSKSLSIFLATTLLGIASANATEYKPMSKEAYKEFEMGIYRKALAPIVDSLVKEARTRNLKDLLKRNADSLINYYASKTTDSLFKETNEITLCIDKPYKISGVTFGTLLSYKPENSYCLAFNSKGNLLYYLSSGIGCPAAQLKEYCKAKSELESALYKQTTITARRISKIFRLRAAKKIANWLSHIEQLSEDQLEQILTGSFEPVELPYWSNKFIALSDFSALAYGKAVVEYLDRIDFKLEKNDYNFSLDEWGKIYDELIFVLASVKPALRMLEKASLESKFVLEPSECKLKGQKIKGQFVPFERDKVKEIKKAHEKNYEEIAKNYSKIKERIEKTKESHLASLKERIEEKTGKAIFNEILRK